MKLYNRLWLLGVATFLILFSFAMTVKAEGYDPYLKVSVAYILAQPNKIYSKTYHQSVELYQGEHLSYNVETGIAVPTEYGNSLNLGVNWYDLINQGESSKTHRPYIFEAFADYVWQWDDQMYVTIGAGYKILQDNTIQKTVDRVTYTVRLSDQTIVDNITARIAIGRKFGNYHLSLEHHSQWMNGKPFNTYWEYHSTTINIGYTF